MCKGYVFTVFFCPWEGESLSGASLASRALCPGGLYPGGSLSRRLFDHGGLCPGRPPVRYVRVVRILLECIPVQFNFKPMQRFSRMTQSFPFKPPYLCVVPHGFLVYGSDTELEVVVLFEPELYRPRPSTMDFTASPLGPRHVLSPRQRSIAYSRNKNVITLTIRIASVEKYYDRKL